MSQDTSSTNLTLASLGKYHQKIKFQQPL